MLEYKCLLCNKKCQRKFDEKLKEQFLNTWKFSNHDDLLEYKCLLCNKNCQRKFPEKLKDQFLNTYKFSNHDYNKFILLLQIGVYHYKYTDDWEKFRISWFVHSKRLLLADVFNNFRMMCLKIYKLDPVNLLSAPGSARQAVLKKTKVKLNFLTDATKKYKRRNMSLHLSICKS